jgi:hypothetical protein
MTTIRRAANVPTPALAITVDVVSISARSYGTNFVAPAMPTIIRKQVDDQLHRNRHQRQIHYPKYFSMVSVGPEGVDCSRLASLTWPPAAEATDNSHPCSRRRIRAPPVPATRSRSTASSWSTTVSYPPTRRICTRKLTLRATNPTSSISVRTCRRMSVPVRAGLTKSGSPKMMGGAMIGMLVTR